MLSIPSPTPTIQRGLALAGCCALSLVIASCSGSSSGGGTPLQPTNSAAELVTIQHGKLVDVYGFRTLNGTQVIELFQNDMITGPDIQDERDTASTKRDEEILYDFISANPDTLQPRLLITREIGSEEFNNAVAALDDKVRTISPNTFGKNSAVSPFSIVPRNAAIRLTFSQKLPIDDSHFYVRDNFGKIIGVKNTNAIQLLKIVGDPTDNNPAGDYEVINTRLAVRDQYIIVDPVLLGTEGRQVDSRNSASGMPESPNQTGANIRLAVATDGPLAIGGISADPIEGLNGLNNDGFASIIRDFRSGNENDNSGDLARGFIRDPIPPRLVGQMLMYIERVQDVNGRAKLVTIFKDGINHELDRGDLIRLFVDDSGVPIGSLEILTEPEDDLGKPNVQRVRVLVRPITNDAGEDVLEMIDPSERPDFPPIANKAREAFLRENAPKAILVAEYTRLRERPAGTGSPNDPFYGDDPSNFLSFSPRPLPDDTTGVVIANQNVSPFAGAIIRFNKPVDMTTLVALDTAFFGTRNVLDEEAIEKFILDRNIDPAKFDENKFRTPHLIHSRIFDEDGSQTAVRIQPTLGFFLDDVMRQHAKEDESKLFSERRNHYFLHLVSGLNGIADLAGNSLDFQAVDIPGVKVQDHLIMEIALDTRDRPGTTQPRYENNLATYIVRRFASRDEDERPSYYLDDEITNPGQATGADAWPSNDLFGPISYLPSGEMVSRQATRLTKVADDLNQQSPPPQTSDLRWCPVTAGSAFMSTTQIVNNTTGTLFGQPIRNPVNPFGCRLQMVWREIDLNLSRTDPLDFNLDVEQMYWAPFTQNAIVFDEFDQMTLYLGHSEYRPETCIASGSAFPSFDESGLRLVFEDNYVHNRSVDNQIEDKPQRHPAYIDAVMTISPKDAILEPNRVNRYLPLPKFVDGRTVSNVKDKFFVWRDEQVYAQGGMNRTSANVPRPYPWLLGPFLSGRGRKVFGTPGNLEFIPGAWHNGLDQQLSNGQTTDTKTGGTVGSIALPLLADFWTHPDSPDKPVSNPFRAGGVNGWQVSLPVTSSARPDFRVYSAGRGGGSPLLIDPTHARWRTARGGFQPGGQATPANDNTFYWMMADFIKRTSVVTSGFIEIGNPHRMPAAGSGDPRLGPYDTTDRLPTYVYDFEPPLSTLPAGTSVVVEFRGASQINRNNQYWPRAVHWRFPPPNNTPTPVQNRNTNKVFPNDPLKAGDAHIRHWDTRNIPGSGGVKRRHFTYMYNEQLTRYTEDPTNLADSNWTNTFSGRFENFDAEDVKYFNWRFVMKNNAEVDPPVSPRVESFAVAYRLSQK